MKKLSIVILIILFFIPAGISAKNDIYGDYRSDSKGSSGSIADDVFGDYFLFSKQQTVSLDLEDARLIDVLKMLSQQTGLNFISTEAVRDRRITLYIQNTQLKKAMDIIFSANNLSYDFYPEAEMFVVKEMGKPEIELKTKVYYLKYTRIKSSKMQKDIDDRMEADDEGGGGQGGDDDDEDTGIKDSIEKVLSAQGRVSADPITNSLIVTDVPAQFPMIDEVIARLDTAPIQVVIEAEILDVNKAIIDEMGFDWPQGLTATFTPFSEALNITDSFRLVSGAATFSGATFDATSTTSIMKFFHQDKKTKFLARPKILTLSNQTAQINLTTDAVIGVEVEYDEENNNRTYTVVRDDLGTKLRVTPQVNQHTNEITLFLELSNKEARDSGFEIASTAEISGIIQDVEERGTKQTVRLEEGETLFMGGLIKNQEQEVVRKVPFLGDIPLLGALFRYKERPSGENTQRELMIFLTPRIVKRRSFAKQTNSKVFFKREQSNPGKEVVVDNTLNKYMQRRSR